MEPRGTGAEIQYLDPDLVLAAAEDLQAFADAMEAREAFALHAEAEGDRRGAGVPTSSRAQSSRPSNPSRRPAGVGASARCPPSP